MHTWGVEPSSLLGSSRCPNRPAWRLASCPSASFLPSLPPPALRAWALTPFSIRRLASKRPRSGHPGTWRPSKYLQQPGTGRSEADAGFGHCATLGSYTDVASQVEALRLALAVGSDLDASAASETH